MVMTTTTTTTTTLNTITRERKGNGCTRKIKKNNNNNKNNPLLIIHHSNRYLHHFLRWYRIRPGRCWLPTVRFPWEESGASAPKGVWDGGEFGLSPGWICINISALYIYIHFIRIIMIIGICGSLSYRTLVSVLIIWEESGASALLELGARSAGISNSSAISLPQQTIRMREQPNFKSLKSHINWDNRIWNDT